MSSKALAETARLRSQALVVPCVPYVSLDAHDGLQIVVHNVRSFRPHADDIFADPNFYRSQVLLLTEARTSPAWPLTHLQVDSDFLPLRAQSDVSARDGFDNVLVFVKSIKNQVAASVYAAVSTPHSQVLCVHLRGHPNPDFYLIGVYKSPSATNTADLLDGIESIRRRVEESDQRRPTPFVCAGDFNVDLLEHDGATSRLTTFMAAHDARLLNSLPTTDRGTLLDHVWISSSLAKSASARNLEAYWSDHSPINVSVRYDRCC